VPLLPHLALAMDDATVCQRWRRNLILISLPENSACLTLEPAVERGVGSRLRATLLTGGGARLPGKAACYDTNATRTNRGYSSPSKAAWQYTIIGTYRLVRFRFQKKKRSRGRRRGLRVAVRPFGRGGPAGGPVARGCALLRGSTGAPPQGAPLGERSHLGRLVAPEGDYPRAANLPSIFAKLVTSKPPPPLRLWCWRLITSSHTRRTQRRYAPSRLLFASRAS